VVVYGVVSVETEKAVEFLVRREGARALRSVTCARRDVTCARLPERSSQRRSAQP
jgi:hypothetical protein